MNRRLRAIIVPLLLIAVSGYFIFNAIHRSRGIKAQGHDAVILAQDRTALAAVLARRDRWQARVAALRHHAIDRDMLDQQAHDVLDLARQGDLSIPTGQDKKKPAATH